MRHLLLLILVVGIEKGIWAQPPFTGGQGDGYARATLSLEASSVAAQDAFPWRIFPQPLRPGQSFRIAAPQPQAGRLILLDWQGRELASWYLRGQRSHRLSLPPLVPSVYLLRWEAAGQVHQQLIQLLP